MAVMFPFQLQEGSLSICGGESSLPSADGRALAQSLASAIVLALGPTGHAMPKLGPGFCTPSE